MKKALVFVLAVVLVLGMAIPAAAEGSSPEQSFLVSSTSGDGKATFLNEAKDLTEEQAEELAKAEEAELEACGKGMDTIDLFYFYTGSTTDAVFYVPDVPHLVVKQYIDGVWVRLEAVINADDDTVEVKDAVAAPMIFYIVPGKISSPSASTRSATATALLPVLVSCTSEDYKLYSVVEEYKLEAVGRQAFLDGQNALRAAVPSGMLARYFFYFSTSTSCSAVFRIENIREVAFKQYVNGAWVELQSAINGDGTVSVDGVVEGPMAIFTK